MNAEQIQAILENPVIYTSLVLWELIWKGLALWKSSQNKQKVWFVAILAINTLGLLPIGYLVYRKIIDKKQITQK